MELLRENGFRFRYLLRVKLDPVMAVTDSAGRGGHRLPFIRFTP